MARKCILHDSCSKDKVGNEKKLKIRQRLVSVQIHPHVGVGIFHGGAVDHHWSWCKTWITLVDLNKFRDGARFRTGRSWRPRWIISFQTYSLLEKRCQNLFATRKKWSDAYKKSLYNQIFTFWPPTKRVLLPLVFFDKLWRHKFFIVRPPKRKSSVGLQVGKQMIYEW